MKQGVDGGEAKFIVVRAWDLMLITLSVDRNNANDPDWYTLNIIKGDSKNAALAGRREVRLHRDEILKMAEFVGRKDSR